MKTKFLKFLGIIKNAIVLKNDDEARFRLNNGLKMTIIPFFSLILTCVFFYILLKMDLIFFEANGFSGTDAYKETYYDFILSKLLWIIPFIIIFFVCVFITGIYISELLLRPFRVIADYCEGVLNDEKGSYDPDFFTDLKLLTSCSEWFFNFMETATLNDDLRPQAIPSKFTKIHGPIFETGFFIQYSMFILITSICAALAIFMIAVDLHNQIVDLAYATLQSKKEIQYFFNHQKSLFEGILYFFLFFHIIAYIAFAFHLYALVSAPAFAIFATMRAFAKGNYSSRVHLVGYSFIRPHARTFNKYLDNMSKQLIKK